MHPNVYWNDEQPYFDKTRLDTINESCAIDTVITHTSPSFCELSSHQGLESWAEHDNTLMFDVQYERKVILFPFLHLILQAPFSHSIY